MLLRLLRERLVPYRHLLAAVVGLQFVSVLAMLYLPSLNARIIDEGIVVGDTGTIVRLGAVMLVVSVAQIIASIAAAWFGARAAMSFGRDLRRDLFQRVGTFSARELQHFGAPSLITRNTNDVTQVQMLVLMACLIAASSPIMMIGGVIMALREDVGLGW
ncbi:ABC transporter transmembrane domain-containing protein, partial [Nocardioides sp.]|uniref:ABC transporter transmembrane domain-containing protein n=1 Tax=Nocardioides sp. TaxID=35761 RepID=UPI002B27B321